MDYLQASGWYAFSTNDQRFRKRNGERCKILKFLSPDVVDESEVGFMFEVMFGDETKADVFACELDLPESKWAILDPGMWENECGPKDWYALMHEDRGIVAYAGEEEMINQMFKAERIKELICV